MASDLDDVPKLPRGRGLKFTGPQLFRIAMALVLLVAIIVMAKPCGNAVSNFVMGFEGSGGSGAAPGSSAPAQFEQLKPGMSEAEIKAAIERSKARAAGSAAGSAN